MELHLLEKKKDEKRNENYAIAFILHIHDRPTTVNNVSECTRNTQSVCVCNEMHSACDCFKHDYLFELNYVYAYAKNDFVC